MVCYLRILGIFLIMNSAIESLFAPASSDGRKLWGFEVFRLSISRVPASELPRLFTPNFMRSWVNHLSKPDRYLHKAAKLVVSSYCRLVRQDV